jgi:hypothetical protein
MTKKHKVHKLERRILGKKRDYIVYACVLPGCSFYISRDLAKGTLNTCWKCGAQHALVAKDLQYKKPLCSNCRGTLRPDIAEFNKKKAGRKEIVSSGNDDLKGFIDVALRNILSVNE